MAGKYPYFYNSLDGTQINVPVRVVYEIHGGNGVVAVITGPDIKSECTRGGLGYLCALWDRVTISPQPASEPSISDLHNVLEIKKG